MLHYPYFFQPVAFYIGPVAVHWYGLMYLLGFVCAWALALYRAYQFSSGWNKTLVADLIFYAAVGVIVGGRLGYMIFYDFSVFIEKPWILFRIWEGGMSFHGGVMGVGVATWMYARRFQKSWVAVIDFIVPMVPIGLGAGRIGNFINGELWGRVTNMPWGVYFPGADPLPRHPSQLYEFLLEGVVLFIILWCFSMKRRPPFAVSALFLFCYGVFRFCVEFFRQPDSQLGFVACEWLTRGQELSIPMIVIGAVAFCFTYRRAYRKSHD